MHRAAARHWRLRLTATAVGVLTEAAASAEPGVNRWLACYSP